jgi:hypothetical protein
MSKGKAKVASKNNPNAREKAAEFLYDGKKVKPVKVVSVGSTFFGAEDDTGELMLDQHGNALSWDSVAASATRA